MLAPQVCAMKIDSRPTTAWGQVHRGACPHEGGGMTKWTEKKGNKVKVSQTITYSLPVIDNSASSEDAGMVRAS